MNLKESTTILKPEVMELENKINKLVSDFEEKYKLRVFLEYNKRKNGRYSTTLIIDNPDWAMPVF